MKEFSSVRSSDLEPQTLRQLINEHAEREQVQEFRRYFLIRLAVAGAVVWLFSWPIQLLPHTVLWVFLAIVALLVGLTSPPRHHAASRDTTPMRTR